MVTSAYGCHSQASVEGGYVLEVIDTCSIVDPNDDTESTRVSILNSSASTADDNVRVLFLLPLSHHLMIDAASECIGGAKETWEALLY